MTTQEQTVLDQYGVIKELHKRLLKADQDFTDKISNLSNFKEFEILELQNQISSFIHKFRTELNSAHDVIKTFKRNNLIDTDIFSETESYLNTIKKEFEIFSFDIPNYLNTRISENIPFQEHENSVHGLFFTEKEWNSPRSKPDKYADY